MDELHMLDLDTNTWTSVSTKGPRPAARYLHTAVLIDDAMLVYGGNSKTLGDVWSFNLTQRAWTKLSKVCDILRRPDTPLTFWQVCIMLTSMHFKLQLCTCSAVAYRVGPVLWASTDLQLSICSVRWSQPMTVTV